MANEKPTILTKQGKIDLEKKLTYLKTIKREQVAERIRTAREFGDISENAEYESAKAEQGFVEGTISEIERVLQNCKVIDTDERFPGLEIIVGKTFVQDHFILNVQFFDGFPGGSNQIVIGVKYENRILQGAKGVFNRRLKAALKRKKL